MGVIGTKLINASVWVRLQKSEKSFSHSFHVFDWWICGVVGIVRVWGFASANAF